MLQELTFTPMSIVLLAIVAAWTVWAVRRLIGRGMCDCHDKCSGCSGKPAQGVQGTQDDSGCACCSAADDMVARMEASIQERA